MTAIENLHAIRDNRADPPALYQTLGIAVASAEPGHVSLTLTPSDRLRSPLGTVGGGVVATVLDTAMAWACDTMLPDGKVCTTLEIKTNFLRPGAIDAGPLTAQAHVLHGGSRIMVAQAEFLDETGAAYAAATATCMVIDKLS